MRDATRLLAVAAGLGASTLWLCVCALGPREPGARQTEVACALRAPLAAAQAAAGPAPQAAAGARERLRAAARTLRVVRAPDGAPVGGANVLAVDTRALGDDPRLERDYGWEQMQRHGQHLVADADGRVTLSAAEGELVVCAFTRESWDVRNVKPDACGTLELAVAALDLGKALDQCGGQPLPGDSHRVFPAPLLEASP